MDNLYNDKERWLIEQVFNGDPKAMASELLERANRRFPHMRTRWESSPVESMVEIGTIQNIKVVELGRQNGLVITRLTTGTIRFEIRAIGTLKGNAVAGERGTAATMTPLTCQELCVELMQMTEQMMGHVG